MIISSDESVPSDTEPLQLQPSAPPMSGLAVDARGRGERPSVPAAKKGRPGSLKQSSFEQEELSEMLSRQHREVVSTLARHEGILRRMWKAHVDSSSDNYSVMSRRSSNDSRVSRNSVHNPRSLHVQGKVDVVYMMAQEEALQKSDDSRMAKLSVVSESGKSASDGPKSVQSNATLFQSFTAFDLGLKEEAEAAQADIRRRRFASMKKIQGYINKTSIGMASTKTLRTVESVVKHPLFDAFFALVVFANAIFTGFEVESSIRNDSLLSLEVVRMSHYIFGALFTIELLCRIVITGWVFFWNYDWIWNYLDIVIVISSLVEIVVDVIGSESDGGRSPMMGFKVFRIIRLTRIIKTVRLVRIFRFVAALRTLVTSIVHTLKALFWALTLLGLIVYVFAVLFAQAVYDHRLDYGGLPAQEELLAQKFFSTLPLTMLSLFMSIAGGVSWEEVVRPLILMDVTWVFLFLFYVSFTYFAVLNVVTGVFCQSAIENAQNDHAAVVQNILDHKEAHMRKIRTLFAEIGADESGVITYDMLHDQFQTAAVREYFESLGLDVSDAWSFFKLLDMDGGGAVEIEEFLLGCLRLRGSARAMDMAKLMFDQNWLIKSHSQFQQFVQTELINLKDQVEELVERKR